MHKKESYHMKCPYNTSSVTVNTQTTHEYDDDGKEIFDSQISVEQTNALMDCTEADCAAWQGNHCCRTV
jgi:hypothetical protein